MRWVLLAILLLTSAPAVCSAQPTAQPQSAPAPTATQPQEQSDPAAVALLERIEQKAQAIKTLAATLRYDRIQGLLGDKQRRFGTLYYVAGPPARFAAHFDRLLADRRMDKQDRWYIFDGVWLVEKLADQTPKQFFKRQIVAPDSQPDQADPLALGGGPFVLPVNMKKDLVLKRFAVRSAAPDAAQDPAHSIHLILTPKPGTRADVSRIDLWYDRETLLPLRVHTFDQDSGNESIIDLTDQRINAIIDAAVIDTAEPKEPGWEMVITPWERK